MVGPTCDGGTAPDGGPEPASPTTYGDMPAYKTLKFWAVAVLTLLGLTLASGIVVEGSKVAEVMGWVVTLLVSLGFRGWVPSKDDGPTEV